MAAVYKEVASSRSGTEEGSPPPVVVLGTEVKVAEQDCGLRAGDDEDHEHEEQETEHVIHLAGPKGIQNKE